VPIRDILAGAAVLALAASSPATAGEPVVLTPSGAWNVEYARESCILARAFKWDNAPVYFRMEQYEPGAQFEVSLVRSPLSSRKVTEDVQVRFGEDPNIEPITAAALFGETDDNVPALSFLLNLRQAAGGDPSDETELTPAEIAGLADLRVALVRGGDEVVFKTGPLTQALGAMRVCMDKLLTQWGIDPAKQTGLSQRVQPINSERWIRPDDYPKGGLHAGRSASVHFRVTVNQNGLVEDCAIQSATEGADFARRTCAVISRRAKFQPALDEDGKPVPSYYVNTIRWLMRLDDRGARISSQVFDDVSRGGRAF
jgi:hypothetical protein